MSIALSLEHPARRYRARVTGTVNLDEMLRYFRRQAEDGVFGYAGLVDARAAELPLTAKELADLVLELERLSERESMGRRAVLAGSESTRHGALILATLTEPFGQGIRVFTDEAAARAWLGWSDGGPQLGFVRWT